jgi:hypothetical protein
MPEMATMKNKDNFRARFSEAEYWRLLAGIDLFIKSGPPVRHIVIQRDVHFFAEPTEALA